MKGAEPTRAGAGTVTASEDRPAIFERTEEVERLRLRLSSRRSFLFHGPAGAGKTLLLSAVLPEFPDMLYSGSNATPLALHRKLAELLAGGDPGFARAAVNLNGKSAVALKGLVRDALSNSAYTVVLDHLIRPSQSLAAVVRELMVNWSVPVIAVARSAHMEDAGYLLPLFADRADKLELRGFDDGRALRFAEEFARRDGLAADNLPQFMDKLVEYSQGNPGAMLRMIRMARDAKYVHHNRIKIAPLYIDYKLATLSR